MEVRCDGTATVLSGFTWPTGDNWTFVESGDISLNEFAGKKIRVAFRYTSTSTIASTWEIKKMTVSGKKMTDGISDAATITNSKEPRHAHRQRFSRRARRARRLGHRRGGHVLGHHQQLRPSRAGGRYILSLSNETRYAGLSFEKAAARRSTLAYARTFASREVCLPTHMSPAKMI